MLPPPPTIHLPFSKTHTHVLTHPFTVSLPGGHVRTVQTPTAGRSEVRVGSPVGGNSGLGALLTVTSWHSPWPGNLLRGTKPVWMRSTLSCVRNRTCASSFWLRTQQRCWCNQLYLQAVRSLMTRLQQIRLEHFGTDLHLEAVTTASIKNDCTTDSMPYFRTINVHVVTAKGVNCKKKTSKRISGFTEKWFDELLKYFIHSLFVEMIMRFSWQLNFKS